MSGHNTQQEVLARAFLAGSVCMAISDQESRFVEVNDAFAAYFDLSRQDMVGRTVTELAILRDPSMAEEIADSLARSGRVQDKVVEFVTRGGTRRDALLSIQAIGIGGETLRLTVLTDITDRLRTERRMAMLNRVLAVLTDVNQALVRMREPAAVYEQACHAAVEKGGFAVAWIGVVDPLTGKLEPVASAGAGGAELSRHHGKAPLRDHDCTVERALVQGARAVRILTDTAGEEGCGAVGRRQGLCSMASFPLRLDGRTKGILSLGATTVDAFADDGPALLEELASDISFAMELARKDLQRTRAELALRESEARYRDLVRRSPQAILVVREERVIFANPAAVTFFAAASEARVVGARTRDLFSAETLPVVEELVRRASREETSLPVRGRALRVDGGVRDAEISVAGFADAGGPVLQVILHEVTEQVRSADALRESEGRLKKAQALAHVGNWEIDLSARTIWGSEEAVQIYGLDVTRTVVDLPVIQELVLPVDRARLDEALQELVMHGTPYDEEFSIRRASDGAVRRLHSRAERVLAPGGVPRAVVGVVQDITERKEAEDALRTSEEMLRTTLYSIGDGVITTAPDGRVTRMNRSAELMTGWEEEAARGRSIEEVFPLVDGETGAGVPHPVLRAMAEDRAIVSGVNDAVVARGGTRRHVSCSAAPIRAAQGDGSGAVLVFEDHTRERELELQVRQAQKLEAVGRLAGGIAHDYNNMIAVILGYTQVLQQELRPMDPLQETVTGISEAARRSAGLTRQLLAFARRQIVAPVALDLNSAILAVEKMLRRLIGEDIELRLRLHRPLWTTRIDPTQVDQVLANLCTNARDAIQDTGTITVETSLLAIDAAAARALMAPAAGEYVVLSFRDTGSGMDKETLARIFEPFFTTKPEGRGTGLGLATVFGIVAQNGGFITVESAPGKGTSFGLHFPRFEGDAFSAGAPAANEPLRGTETVLLVEDEEQLLKLTRMALETNGYTVLAASSPGDALLLCENHAGAIDILVTDVVMPGMNGRQLFERCRMLQPGMKVLYVSGYGAELLADRGILSNGVALLTKPFTPEALARKTREVLGPGGWTAPDRAGKNTP